MSDLCHPKAVKRNKDSSVTMKLKLSQEQWQLLEGISFDLNRKQCACDLVAKLLWESLEQLLRDIANAPSENKQPN